jgi:hypothetical protein
MPPVGFEPTISVLERAKTVRSTDERLIINWLFEMRALVLALLDVSFVSQIPH